MSEIIPINVWYKCKNNNILSGLYLWKKYEVLNTNTEIK